MKFAERMNQFGEGVFARLAYMKKQKIAEGHEVIDLSIGAPNIPPPEHVMKVLAEESMKPENYVYAITDTRELLNEVSEWYKRRYSVALDPENEICSLLGSQEGLSHIALTIIDDDELTLVPDPCYPVFADGPKIANSSLYYMPQKRENDYVIKLSDIPADVAHRAKFMVVSYPNNPTTAIAPDSFYEELVAFAKKYDIIVLHDNAYSELVFGGNHCGSFLAFKGAKDVGVEFNSLSKTYGLAGARIGFCVGNKDVVSYVKTLKSNMDYGMFLPIQKAAIAALRSPQSVIENTRQAYVERIDALIDGLVEVGWNIDKPKATMFVWAAVPIRNAKFGMRNWSSEEFTIELLNKAGIIVTPGSAFGPNGEGFVRMALVQSTENMRRVSEKIKLMQN